MQLGVIAYAPPPGVCQAEAFLANLKESPPKNPLVLYSDHGWPGVERIPAVKRFGPNRWSVSNLVFLHGLRLAIGRGWTHFIYLESDCRVGQEGWDEAMADEFWHLPNWEGLIAAGSLAVYNPFNAGGDAARRFCELVSRHNIRRNYPIPGYLPVRAFGNKEQTDGSGSCVFVNGALGLFHVEQLKALFGKVEIVGAAQRMGAWDAEIGRRAWAKHGVKAYELFGVMSCVYSGYGEIVTSEEQRRHLLESESVVAVHQIKSEWRPKGKERPKPERLKSPSKVPVIDLSQSTTLWGCVWCDDEGRLERTIRVMKYCCGFMRFKELLLFSVIKPPEIPEGWRAVQIPRLDVDGFNMFHIRIVPEYIRTEFAMSVHDDGFPIRPDLWDEQFLAFDFIGAPWAPGVVSNPEPMVGNAGFAIESQKFMQNKKNIPFLSRQENNCSDVAVCLTHRKKMESAGVRIAPADLALRFSTETMGNERPSFGYHGRLHSPEKHKLGWLAVRNSELCVS